MQRKRKATCAKKKKAPCEKRKGTRCKPCAKKGHHVQKRGTMWKKEKYHMQRKKGKIPCAKKRRNTMWKEIGKVPCANKEAQ